MKAVLEGLLFVVGDDGLNLTQLSEILNIDEDKVKELILELQRDYQNSDRGIIIKNFGNNYKLTTKSEHKKYYEKLSEISDTRTLSQAALETLAIIAYNEPITRLHVDELRGVNSSQMIRNLIAKDFVRELGKSDTIGKPNLYGITSKFLDYFGLKSKEELPKINELPDNEEVDLYNSKYQEVEVEQL